MQYLNELLFAVDTIKDLEWTTHDEPDISIGPPPEYRPDLRKGFKDFDVIYNAVTNALSSAFVILRNRPNYLSQVAQRRLGPVYSAIHDRINPRTSS